MPNVKNGQLSAHHTTIRSACQAFGFVFFSVSRYPVYMKRLKQFKGGLTICYIGNGKGKTTAAVGVAVRAAGYGKRVAFVQFFKSKQWPSGERASLAKLGIAVMVLGKGFVGIWGDKLSLATHKQAARQALAKSKALVMSGRYDLVILDEIISSIESGLISVKDVVILLRQRKKSVKARKTHIILTGHTKYPKILALADLVTEMRSLRHPFDKGFLAVKGIDY